jgi:uncharacterized protein involved in high-affinity Fe2+ transport
MNSGPLSRRRARWLVRRRAGGILALLSAGLLLAGCAAANKNQSAGSGSSGMAGMNMGSTVTTAVPVVNGIRPVPIQTLATRYWQGMEIQAQTRTPVRFIQFDGDKEQMVNPPNHASFHLMVMLSDQRTGEPMPYSSSVWATITNSAGRVVYDSQQWAMISAYMGPHYGDNVPRLASGRYKLKVLISPPDAARAIEYKNVWLKPHEVTMYFQWNAKTDIATVIGGSRGAGSAGSMSSMAGMSSVHTNVSVNGVRATPSRLIATAYWQGMRIQTRTAAPTLFYMPDGSGVGKVDPAVGSSLYLTVMLSDRYTSEAVTYAPVYATIKNAAGKAVYHGRMEPTISAFEGPYYGNNVKLPGAGQYELILRIDPPHQARHLEYQHVWLQPHTVVEHFTWDGKQ